MIQLVKIVYRSKENKDRFVLIDTCSKLRSLQDFNYIRIIRDINDCEWLSLSDMRYSLFEVETISILHECETKDEMFNHFIEELI